MALLDFLGRAATAGVGAEAAKLEGEAAGRKTAQADLLARLQMEQDAANQRRQQALADAQIRNYESQIQQRSQPDAPTLRNIDPLSPQGIEARLEYERRAPKGTATPAAGSFTQFTGPDGNPVFFNPQTGASVKAPEGFKPPSTRAGLPTVEERKAAAFYASGKQGYETLERLLGGDDPSTPQVETGKGKEVPGWIATQMQRVGMGAGNVMTNADVRQMRQAALMLSDAWLRYTSGAAVPETEVERFAESFIPRPGDDPGTLEQKRQARSTIIEALKRGAGRALDPSLVGTQPDLDAQIDAVLGGRP